MRKLVVLFLGLLLLFANCSKNTGDTCNLTGNWINKQKDTLSFINDWMVEYKPHKTNDKFLLYSYKTSKESITLWLTHSSSTNDLKEYYFKCSDKQIEIRDFQNIKRDVYKRLK